MIDSDSAHYDSSYTHMLTIPLVQVVQANQGKHSHIYIDIGQKKKKKTKKKKILEFFTWLIESDSI